MRFLEWSISQRQKVGRKVSGAGRKEGMLFNRDRVSFLPDEKGSGDGWWQWAPTM